MLSCDNTKVTKIAYFTFCDYEESRDFLAMVEGDVTTEKAIGNMYDIGIFANEGETKHVTTEIAASYFLLDKTAGNQYIMMR